MLLDDSAAALACLSPVGQAIIGPASLIVRESLLMFASVQGWLTVNYEDYRMWASAQLDAEYVWLALDPFFLKGHRCDVTAMDLRLSRSASGGELHIDAILPESVREVVRNREVGLLDDAVWSGQTVRRAADLVRSAGGSIEDVVVCVSAIAARRSIAADVPGVAWAQFVEGDHAAIHMRDACPFMPFGGRTVKGEATASADPSLRVVHHPMHFKGPWEAVRRSRHVSEAIRVAGRMIEAGLTRELERPATVADVVALGLGVAIPRFRDIAVTSETLLKEIVV